MSAFALAIALLVAAFVTLWLISTDRAVWSWRRVADEIPSGQSIGADSLAEARKVAGYREPEYAIQSEVRAPCARIAIAHRLDMFRDERGVPKAKKTKVLMILVEEDVRTKVEAKAIAATILACAEELES